MGFDSLETSGLQFTPEGRIPSGIHDCTLAEMLPLVCTNAHREVLWVRLMSFFIWPLLVNRFSYAYIGGGYLSSAGNPEDVDVILQTKAKYGPESFASVERFFLVGLEQVREFYSVDLHFWMEGAPTGFADYRSFFQYDRPPSKSGTLLRQRGLVRISLTDPQTRADVKRCLGQCRLSGGQLTQTSFQSPDDGTKRDGRERIQ